MGPRLVDRDVARRVDVAPRPARRAMVDPVGSGTPRPQGGTSGGAVERHVDARVVEDVAHLAVLHLVERPLAVVDTRQRRARKKPLSGRCVSTLPIDAGASATPRSTVALGVEPVRLRADALAKAAGVVAGPCVASQSWWRGARLRAREGAVVRPAAHHRPEERVEARGRVVGGRGVGGRGERRRVAASGRARRPAETFRGQREGWGGRARCFMAVTGGTTRRAVGCSEVPEWALSRGCGRARPPPSPLAELSRVGLRRRKRHEEGRCCVQTPPHSLRSALVRSRLRTTNVDDPIPRVDVPGGPSSAASCGPAEARARASGMEARPRPHRET